MSHYFETPHGRADTFDVPMRLAGHDVVMESSKGVFSGTGLDLGTSVLLRTVTPPIGPARILDLGCGIGPITVAIGLQAPRAHITAVDTNERALELTRRNVERLGLGDRVTVALPDEVGSQVRFDAIWSNPPIRIGKQALHDVLLTWLPRLTPEGVATLVVARNLGADSLAAWLDEQGWPASKIASAKGFRVLSVTRP